MSLVSASLGSYLIGRVWSYRRDMVLTDRPLTGGSVCMCVFVFVGVCAAADEGRLHKHARLYRSLL